MPLSYLEHDPVVKSNIETIYEISASGRYQEVIIRLLHPPIFEDFSGTIELLQSKLFLLRLVGNVMSMHWKSLRNTSRSKEFPEAGYRYDSASYTFSDRSTDGSVTPAFEKSFAAELSSNFIDPKPFFDPPSMDETFVKWAFVLALKAFQSGSAMAPSNTPNATMISPLVSFQAFHDFITVERVPAFVERSLTPVDKSLSILSPLEVFCDSKLINPFHGLFSPTKDSEFETQPTEAIVSAYSTADLQREIFKASARLLYYFSSSNFGLIFTRFKAKLLSFQGSSSENIADPEIFEFRMLEWFNFDRYRLGLFISEIHQFFPSLSNFAQGLASSLLTRAVMNWIDAYPGEYNALYRTKGRFEGAPDLMFDLLGQAAESTGRKAVFWPSMSALLCLCPETFVDMAKTTLTAETSFNRVHCTNAQGVYLTPTDRRRYFFDDLKFGIRSTILYESAAFCISTLLRGATVLSDHDQQLCHNLVNIFDEDCRAHVFNPKVLSYNPLGSDSDIFDLTIPASILVSFYRLNTTHTLNYYVPLLLEQHTSTFAPKMAFIRMCHDLVMEPNRHPSICSLDASLGAPLRRLLTENIRLTRSQVTIVNAVGLPKTSVWPWAECHPIIFPGLNQAPKTGRATPGGSKEGSGPVPAVAPKKPVFNKERKANASGQVSAPVVEQYDSYPHLEMTTRILRIFVKCPMLVFSQRDGQYISFDDFRGFVATVCLGVLDMNRVIRTEASKLLSIMVEPKWISYWDESRNLQNLPEAEAVAKRMRHYWILTSTILGIIARHLIEFRGDVLDPTMTGIVIAKNAHSLIHTILTKRNVYLKQIKKEYATIGYGSVEHLAASNCLETLYLLTLAHCEPDVAQSAIKGIGLCIEELEYIQVISDGYLTQPYNGLGFVDNLSTYKDLVEELGQEAVIGQKALQKRIRTIIKNISHSTMATTWAFSEMYKRWRILTGMLVHKVSGPDKPAVPNMLAVAPSAPGPQGQGKEQPVAPSKPTPSITIEGIVVPLALAEASPAMNEFLAAEFQRRLGKPAARFSGTDPEYLEDNGQWVNYTGFLCTIGHTLTSGWGLLTLDSIVPLIFRSENQPPLPIAPPRKHFGGLKEGIKETFREGFKEFKSNVASVATSEPLEPAPNLQAASQLGGQIPGSPEGWVITELDLQVMTNAAIPSLIPILSGRFNTEKLATVLTNNEIFENGNVTLSGRLLVERFVTDMTELLVCDSKYVRGIAREHVGGSFSHSLCAIFVNQIGLINNYYLADNAASEDYVTGERALVFVEASIVALKTIFERSEEFGRMNNLVNFDFGQLITFFVPYLDRLHTKSSQAVALRVKCRLAQAVEQLVTHKYCLGLRQEIKFRNAMTRVFIDWNSDYSLLNEPNVYAKSHESHNDDGANERTDIDKAPYTEPTTVYSKQHRELDTACLKAMVVLLRHLPLQPVARPGASMTSISSDETKTKIFSSHLGFFLHVITTCNRVLESLPARSPQDDYEDKPAYQHVAPMRDSAVLCLSHLLSANIEIGLKYSLPLAYHRDLNIRMTFIQVLTTMLQDGTQKFSGLGEQASLIRDRYKMLLELILDSELTIVLGLCQVSNVTEVEDLAQTLMNVFSVRGEELPLLKAVITQDLSKTDSPHGFFRSNSVATRLWTIFARSVGAEYLQLAIQPILLDLVARNPPLEIELEKAGSAEIQRANIENIKEITEQLLDSIIRHINSIPPKFREICAHVSAALQKKFPDYPYVAVGTFLFLRFFCPAIVAPESHNLVQTISQRELRRGLVLITKALQHLANYAMFGVSNKENSIGILDEILKSNIGKVTWYLKELSSWSGATHEPLPAPNRMIKFPDYDLFALQRQLAVNIERMEATLAQNSVNPVLRRRRSTIGLQQPGNAPRRSSQGAIDVSGSDERLDAHMQKRWYYQQLSTILAQLDGAVSPGTTLDNALMTSTVYTTSVPLNGALERAIYEGGRSKSGRPVLYIIAKRCDLSDPEGIIHALNVELQPLTSLPFDILLDLSGFNTSSSDRSEALLYQLTNMLSYEVDLNCQQIIIYNMNSRAYQLHMATSHFIHPKVVSRLVYCSGLAELEEYIEPAHMKMPRDTFVEVKPSKFNFTTMVYSASSHNIGSFILTATDEHIVLTGTKKQPVFDSTVTVCNIIDFRDVVEIGRVGSSRTSESEFQISYVYQQQSVRGISHRQTFTESFSSSQRELIVRSLRAAKSRFDIANPVDHRLTPSRQLRPQDVPAVFLNISLMNLGSRNSLLKWISYDLLCKTTQAYGLSIEGLLVSPDLCLPTNVRDFLFNISKSIADKDNSIALDIVAEALTAFQQVGTRIKYHILAYIKPWLTAFGEIIPPTATLPDFRAVDEDLNVVKACDIFRIMVELSMVEIDMMPEIVHGFWAPFASVEEILPLLIDVVLEDSLRSGPFSPRTNTLTMIIMEVSVKNKPLVFGRILGRIRKALQYSSTTPARCLVDHPVFAEIMTLSRYILNLSFNDSHMARQYLPDLFHIVTCLLGLGPPLFRSTIHGIAVNVVQSLCTSTGHAHPNGPQLFQILKDFSESKLLTAFALSGYNHLQYQLGSTSVTVNFTANTRTGLGSSDNLMDVSREVLLTNLEDVFQTLLSALNLAAKDARQAAMWKSRWMSLVSGTAFVFNPALQPRTFVALGCLAGRDTDDDLLYQILVAFRGSLTLYEEFDVTLLVSCFMCMGNIVRLLSRNSRYLKVLFWIVLSAVMISHPPVFQAAASVLQILVRKLDESGAFDHAPMADVLLDAKIPAEEYFDKIEAAYGISFRSDFGFALTTVLLKGLKHPATKATTTLLFTTLLEVHTRNAQLHTFSPEGAAVMIETDRLYYMLPLLPFTENLKILLLSAGILDSNSIDDAGVFAAAPSDGEGGKDAPRKLRYQGILKAVQFTEPKSMMLTLALLMTMLDNAEYDSETLCILEALAECAKFMPGILSLLHDHLIPRAVQVISTSKNVKVVEVAQSILIVLMRHPQFGMINHGNIGGGFEQASLGAAAPSITTTLGALPDEFPPATYLAKLGFPGLLECGSFQSVHKKKRAQLVQLVLWLTEFWI